MRETEGELLARIDATRSRMGETIEEIGDRVNPARVQEEIKARAREQVREAKANVKHKARKAMRDIEHEVSDAGRTVWDTVRENPIPAGMVGLGLAWLMANGVSRHDDPELEHHGYPQAGPAAGQGYGGSAAMAAGRYDEVGYGEVDDGGESVRERASEAADSVRERAGEAAEEIRDRASHMTERASEGMEEMKHRAAHAARSAGRRARRAERRVEHAVEDNPLAAGAIAAALGFAAGLMVPESRKEHEMFGPARDRVMDRAERTVRKAGRKARETAKDVASESARSAVDEVTGGGESRERAAVSEPGR